MRYAFLFLLFAAAPVLGQRGPGAGATENVARAIGEQQQAVREAVKQAEMMAAVMGHHQNAQEALERGVSVAKVTGLDTALSEIEKAKQRAAISTDPSLRKMILAAETMLNDARLLAGAVDMPQLIERFHHGPIHEMQRYVLRNTGTLQHTSDRYAELANMLNSMSRQLRDAQSPVVRSTIPRKENLRE